MIKSRAAVVYRRAMFSPGLDPRKEEIHPESSRRPKLFFRALRMPSDWSALFGYDIFISYKREEASALAIALERDLRELGFECFLDRTNAPPGLLLTEHLKQALGRSKVLALIVTPQALTSAWVTQELSIFRERRPRSVIPIDVNGCFSRLATDDEAWRSLWKADVIRLNATWEESQSDQPKPRLANAIADHFNYVRARTARRLTTAGIILVLLATSCFSVWKAIEATRSAQIAAEQRRAAISSAQEAQRQAQVARQEEARARHQQELAESRARESLSAQFATESVAALSEDPERAILLSLYAVNVTLATDHKVIPAAEDALHRAIQFSPLRVTMRAKVSAAPGIGAAILRTVALSRDGNRFAVAEDGTVAVWEVPSGRRLLGIVQSYVVKMAFSPDATRLAASLVDGSVAIWDLASREKRVVLSGHTKIVTAIAFSPDGKFVLTGSEDGTGKLWSAANGENLFTVRAGAGAVRAVVVSPDGAQLATAGQDGGAWVWDAATGREIQALREPEDVFCLAFSPDGKQIATGGAGRLLRNGEAYGLTAKIWDVATGKLLVAVNEGFGSVFALAFSPDGRRLATSNGTTPVIWDTATGRQLQVLRGPEESERELVFTADGRRLVTANKDGVVRVWNTGVNEELLAFRAHLRPVSGVAFSPDSRLLASGSWDGTARLWDSVTGQPRLTLEADKLVSAVAFSPNGKLLATGGGVGSPKIWNTATGRLLSTLPGPPGLVYGLAFTPDGRRLGTAGPGNSAKLRDLASGREVLTLSSHSAAAYTLAFSTDGKLAATGGGDSTVTIWDAAGGRQLSILRGHTEGVSRVAFSPDSSRLVTAGLDKIVRVWDMAGRELFSLRGHTALVSDAAFSPDGNRLASGSSDDTVKIWNARTGQELLTLRSPSNASGVLAFSPDGKRLASAGADGWVQVFAMDLDDLTALARERLTRSFTAEECKRYFSNLPCPEGR